MKRFALILALFLPILAISETLPRIYDAPRTGEKMKIDGYLTEKSWESAPFSDDFTDIRGLNFPTPAMKTNVKMLWDNECLYIGARIEEKKITGDITKRDDIIWKNHDFEVFIDPYSDGGVFIMNWDCKGLQLAVSYDGTLNNPKDTDRAWKVLARSGAYLISPREIYECTGDVPNVTFPCAALYEKETGKVAVYYGCADTVTGLAFGYLPEIIKFTKETNIIK
ncbi:MAG: hypothetical protein KBS72_04225 [Bacteroidales bacterium]|nr:hypothetical protein [Candidatus Cacconaster scatequi]